MSIMNVLRPIELNEIPQDHFVVVHPLDDVPEQKWTPQPWDRCP